MTRIEKKAKAATKRDWVVGEGVGAADGNGDWDGGIWRPGMTAIELTTAETDEVS